MAVNLSPPEHLAPVAGVELATIAAGIRYRNRPDLLLIRLAEGSRVAAVFTRNAFCAAPVTLARQHLRHGPQVRGLLINAGNANAGTGAAGLQAAQRSCELAADALGVAAHCVLPFSTGVIGAQLPVAAFERGMPALASGLAADRWHDAARCIMTTDTVAKGFSRQLELSGRRITLTGIAKGAGMIRPDMATMLAFITTDAPVEPGALQRALEQAVDDSFNAITVDGDTSTNDACVLAATGQAGGAELVAGDEEYLLFCDALKALCQSLAQACVRDAEGATRFITVKISGARDRDEARKVAYTIAESPLVKTAAFAGDPNWGRILAAVGRSGIEALDLSDVDLFLDDVCLLRGGEPDPDYREEAGARVARQAEFCIDVRLGRGQAETRVWTCDYSYDYVKINAEYRS